jgi:hypothetical protein
MTRDRAATYRCVWQQHELLQAMLGPLRRRLWACVYLLCVRNTHGLLQSRNGHRLVRCPAELRLAYPLTKHLLTKDLTIPLTWAVAGSNLCQRSRTLVSVPPARRPVGRHLCRPRIFATYHPAVVNPRERRVATEQPGRPLPIGRPIPRLEPRPK